MAPKKKKTKAAARPAAGGKGKTSTEPSKSTSLGPSPSGVSKQTTSKAGASLQSPASRRKQPLRGKGIDEAIEGDEGEGDGGKEHEAIDHVNEGEAAEEGVDGCADNRPEWGKASREEGGAEEGQNVTEELGKPDRTDTVPAPVTVDSVLIEQIGYDKVFQFNGTNMTMRAFIQVRRYPQDNKCRIGYTGHFFLANRLDGQLKPLEDVRIGTIQAWRINKPTRAHPSTQGKHWRTEYLVPNAYDIPDRIKKCALCMKTLFFPQGQVRPKPVNAGFGDALRDDSLMFIEFVYVEEQYQRKGLLQHILSTFQLVITDGLSEWSAFNGTLVIVPARPMGERGRCWGTRTTENVEEVLSRLFANFGYQIISDFSRVGGFYMTVMGKRIMATTVPAQAAHENQGEVS